MRFAYDFTSLPVLLVAFGCGATLVVFATLLVLRSFQRTRAVARFGDPALVGRLESFDATTRRTVKGVALVLAMACAFAALARPQFGRGTRLIPATNLDVVLVLDYSKSMYARDVVPSRIARSKAEVARLIQQLPGARFAAVAFAGEPMSFPLTSDGAAIAQFFRQLEPNDMPVGGTATARALTRARELLARDPRSKEHVRVIVLVTDGEDLEGDPVAAAQEAAGEGIRVDVVQIGGRAPEMIPEVNADGKVAGYRRDENGQYMTTALSAEGEAQLARIAEVTGGKIVRSEHGETGIDVVARGLSKMMREELSEKVETVYAEEYAWPLGLAVLLFVLEALMGEAPPRRRTAAAAAATERAPKGWARLRLLFATMVMALPFAALGCGWNPARPFDREAPAVKEALDHLDAGDAQAAATTLEEYLSTGPCSEGNIGTPERLRERGDGTFDLGLALFKWGERFGRRFGDEEVDGGGADEPLKAKRKGMVDCATRVVRILEADVKQPLELRARAFYLDGNLNFLDGSYEEAVRAYDQALALEPGQVDAGDAVGRDAAWNRAIAQRRIEENKKKDAGSDASPGDSGSQGDGGGPSQDKNEQDKGDGGAPQPQDGGGAPPDAGPPPKQDGGGDTPDAAPPPEDEDAGAPPPQPSRANADDRMLDQLENAPTVQQEDARKKAGRRRVRGMADK